MGWCRYLRYMRMCSAETCRIGRYIDIVGTDPNAQITLLYSSYGLEGWVLHLSLGNPSDV